MCSGPDDLLTASGIAKSVICFRANTERFYAIRAANVGRIYAGIVPSVIKPVVRG
jgi:hypothetical protein